MTTKIPWVRLRDSDRPGKVWNPTIGCTKGCPYCYARTLHNTRYRARMNGKPMPASYSQPFHKPRLLVDRLGIPLHVRQPTAFFVDSMGDLFDPAIRFEDIAAVFGVMAATPRHRYYLLTKQAQRMEEWFGWIPGHSGIGTPWGGARFATDMGIQSKRLGETIESRPTWNCRDFAEPHLGRRISIETFPGSMTAVPWPLPNVWLGISAENQGTLDDRLPWLLRCPGHLWVSLEPLTGKVSLTSCSIGKRPMGESCRKCLLDNVCSGWGPIDGISWVVSGPMTGPNATPANPDWFRSLRGQCQGASVPMFLKDGSKAMELDGRTWGEVPR